MKKEIVFFPYNPTMWDSMESVWMAAKADPDYDAYVIPIPYFDKDESGNPLNEHYDIDGYPDYVDVLDYRNIDFDHFSADVIVIH